MHKLLAGVRDFYNTSGEYFSKTRTRLWPEIEPYLEKLKAGDLVLDLGCGNGRLLTGIEKDVDYLGIDFSQTLVNKAKKLHPKRKFAIADITQESTWKPLPKFDAIFCIAVLHHIPTRKMQLSFLKRMHVHAKKKGFVFISVWNLWQPKYWKYHLSRKSLKLKSQNPRWLYFPFQRKYSRFLVTFDRRYLTNLLSAAGFKKIKLFYSGKNGEQTNFLFGRNLCAEAS